MASRSGYFSKLNTRETNAIKSLSSFRKVQDYLEKLPINFEEHGETLMSPRRVLREKKCHCIEGAIFAAAVFWFHGQRPLLLDLKTDDKDEGHVAAIFRHKKFWGAVSKTNHSVLRYRDPVYRSLRELVMSYFHEYFMDDGRKTLRSYSAPLNLAKFAGKNWLADEADLWYIDDALESARHYSLVSSSSARILRPADPIEREELRQFEIYGKRKIKNVKRKI